MTTRSTERIPYRSRHVPASRPALLRLGTLRVTPDNFVRAESDLYFGRVARRGFGKLNHSREMTPIDDQRVVRMNRDTIYSSGVFDLDASPLTIALPDAGPRFLSMQIISQDHYTIDVVYAPGRYRYTKETVGTRYAFVAIRVLADPRNPADMAAAHAIQDAIDVQQSSVGRFQAPPWEPESQARVRRALETLGRTMSDSRRAFGAREEVDPVRHLVGTAMGWGANPDTDAMYMSVTPTENDGGTPHQLVLQNVPVDGFWSVSVYDAVGYFFANPFDAYSVNSLTAMREADGSVVIRFGGCDERVANCLPITVGWTAVLRLYRPRPEVLNGTWRPPRTRPIGR